MLRPHGPKSEARIFRLRLPGVRIGVSIVLASLAFGAVAQEPSSADLPSVEVVAHRGASAYAPENTLAAFELAIEMGADWFELDCQLSRDDVVVVMHDLTLDRTTDGQGAVLELSLAELKRLDAGSWKDDRFKGERIPTLEESLRLAGDRIGVYVEIKDVDDDSELKQRLLEIGGSAARFGAKLDPEVIEAIRASGTRNYALTLAALETVRKHMPGRGVVIQSFSPVICAIALVEAPELRTELLAADDSNDADQWGRFVRWMELLDAPGLNPNIRAMHGREADLLRFREKGATISVWTVDGKRDMLTFAAWGVKAVITNRPDTAVATLKAGGFR